MKEKADETNESGLHFIERIHARGRAERAGPAEAQDAFRIAPDGPAR
jgi:hypothetical protein